MSEQSSRANEQDDLRLQHYQQYPEEQRAEVFVPRSNKENPAQPIIEGGWMTVGEGYDDSGNLRVHVQKEMLAEDGTPLGTVAEKDVPKSLLEKCRSKCSRVSLAPRHC